MSLLAIRLLTAQRQQNAEVYFYDEGTAEKDLAVLFQFL